MTREEHLAWAKKRALQILDGGDIQGAIDSLYSDLLKHDELRDHSALPLGTMMLASGHLKTEKAMRHFIEGFN